MKAPAPAMEAKTMPLDRFSEETTADLMRRYRLRREQDAKPFFTTEPPCEDCGSPLSACACNEPDEPICFALYPLIMDARNVAEICAVWQRHQAECPTCKRKQRTEPQQAPSQRRAA